MIRKTFTIFTSTLTAMMIAGCGGSSSSTNDVTETKTQTPEETIATTPQCQVTGTTITAQEGETCEYEGNTLTCEGGRVTLNGMINAQTININGTIFKCR